MRINIFSFAIIAIIFVLNSCNKDAIVVKKLTFQDIETEFNFKKPLSEFTRTKILE